MGFLLRFLDLKEISQTLLKHKTIFVSPFSLLNPMLMTALIYICFELIVSLTKS